MIGFTVPVKIWIGESVEPRHETAIVSLDLDDPDAPLIDIRIAGDDLIVNAEVNDAYDAVSRVQSQLSSWTRERETA